MSNQYEVVVIGSGSAGQKACLIALEAGLRTLLIEKRDYLGGTSYHNGSHAVRALQACANFLKYVEKGSKFGAATDLIETNWTQWLSAQRRTSSILTAEFSRAIDHDQLKVRFGQAVITGPNTVTIHDPRSTSEEVTTDYIIVATGSRPKIPSQPELGLLNSDSLLRRPTMPRHLFVVGGGHIGCELASIYQTLGVQVTLAEAKSRLLPSLDPIAGERFGSLLRTEGVDVLLSEPIDLDARSQTKPAHFRLSTGIVIQPDITLMATGRSPNSDNLGLESVGLPGGDWIPVNECMRTKVDSIFAIGDVNGIALLDSVAAAQAQVAMSTILRTPARFDKRWFPQFLHTDPPIVSIGWTEEEARAAGLNIEALSWRGSMFTDDDLSTVQQEQIALKCVLEVASNRFLGCIVIGSRAAEIVNLVSTAMANGQSARHIANLSVVHPSATEVLVDMLRMHFDHPALV
jgi:pyruvate/2-oxoglutarate dehydrogenase complex dihydrolipoamide dehydrogenase (E3) component